MKLTITNAPATMSSREIAELTGKNHADVMRDIRNILDQLGEVASSFAGYYTAANGKRNPEFALPKDLTLTLVAGYSVPLRHRIVTRWMELERRATPAVPVTYAEALRLAADQQERLTQLEPQALGLDPEASCDTTVEEYINARSLHLSHGNKVRLGQIAASLNKAAGRPRQTREVEYRAKYGFVRTGFKTLYPTDTLDRAFLAMTPA